MLAGLGLARATSRVWWPPALLLAALFPSRRKAIAATILTPAVIDWAKGRRPADAVPAIAIRTIDDMSYGLGVWQGVLAERTITPLLPDLADWPGRRSPAEETTVSGR